MKIQATNPSFAGRINVNKLKTVAKETINLRNSAATSLTAGGAATVTGLAAVDALASGSQLTGTAFVSDASNLNSSGIAASVTEFAAPHVTPATALASQKYPSVVGMLFSTAGGFIEKLNHPKQDVKDPS
ncbi:hypothetical protein IJE86_10615 [bacterium]|nr:hypothetical protein [bacterium]